MRQKKTVLYASHILCLCLALLLTACVSTTVPYQLLSDAKQAFARAKVAVTEKQNSEDNTDLTLAKGMLSDGEAALSRGDFSVATTLFETSKQHSQAILRRRQPNVTPNSRVKFRY